MPSKAWYSFEKDVPKRKIPQKIQVMAGGAAGILATALLHPLDLVKVRRQVHRTDHSNWHMVKEIVHNEGYRALYYGLSAGIMRQVTATTARLTVYYWLNDNYTKTYNRAPKLREKLVLGSCASLVGAVAGTPSEVILIRMMADGADDPCMDKNRHQRRLYKGLFQAIKKVIKNEGVCGLWRGGMLTALRTAILGIIQISTLTSTQKVSTNRKMGALNARKLDLVGSVVSGFLTAVLTLPVDCLKTRLQVRKDRLTAKELFLLKLRLNGLLYFWRGFALYFVRLAIHSSMTYFILEECGEYFSKRPKYKIKDGL